jgi:hypothetical protein
MYVQALNGTELLEDLGICSKWKENWQCGKGQLALFQRIQVRAIRF